jgi:hypothetical protein
MTDNITTREDLTRAEQALSPRQIELRDGAVPDGSGIAARRAERLLHLERELSKKQAKTFELIRLREHVKTAPDVERDVIDWAVTKINKAIAISDENCASLHLEITALRAAR